MVSVILPVFNEEKILNRNAEYFSRLSRRSELIFVDGGSTDNTLQIASTLGKVVSCDKNRALQMNRGVKEASHDILLFLHADTQISIKTLVVIENTIIRKGYVGGCLKRVIDEKGLLFRWIAWIGNVRACVRKVFYGDQGIFMTKEVFEEIEGYPKTSLAEDVLISKKLREMGRLAVLPDYIHCSARRWLKQGILKTFLLNMRISLCLMFGISPDRFAYQYGDIR